MRLAKFFTLLMGLVLLLAGWSPSAQAQQTLQEMVDQIERANGLPDNLVKKAILQQSDQINAGTDGQNVIVYSGLWNRLTTDDARAFVVGHEIAHIVLRHNVKSMGRNLGFNILGRLAGGYLGPLASTATYYGLQLTNLKFDRGQEYQADDTGMNLVWKAGYKPAGAYEVFNVLRQQDKGGGPPEFLRTHPLSENRINMLVKQYQAKGKPLGFTTTSLATPSDGMGLATLEGPSQSSFPAPWSPGLLPEKPNAAQRFGMSPSP